MREPVTLPLHCLYCHGAVELQFADWTGDACQRKPGRWTCPYCRKESTGAFPGKIAKVSPRLPA